MFHLETLPIALPKPQNIPFCSESTFHSNFLLLFPSESQVYTQDVTSLETHRHMSCLTAHSVSVLQSKHPVVKKEIQVILVLTIFYDAIKRCPDSSFPNTFWTVRSTVLRTPCSFGRINGRENRVSSLVHRKEKQQQYAARIYSDSSDRHRQEKNKRGNAFGIEMLSRKGFPTSNS